MQDYLLQIKPTIDTKKWNPDRRQGLAKKVSNFDSY